VCVCVCVCVFVCVRVGRDVGERYHGRLRHAGAQRGPGWLCQPGWQAWGGGRHLGRQRRVHLQSDQRQGQSRAPQTLRRRAGDKVRSQSLSNGSRTKKFNKEKIKKNRAVRHGAAHTQLHESSAESVSSLEKPDL